jgi:hypothetical protein
MSFLSGDVIAGKTMSQGLTVLKNSIFQAHGHWLHWSNQFMYQFFKALSSTHLFDIQKFI